MPAGDWSYPDSLEIPLSWPDEGIFHFCGFNAEYLAFVLGAVEKLQSPEIWGDDDEALQKIGTLLNELATPRESENSVTLPIGATIPFAGAAAPAGWLLCDGAAVSRDTYANLFAAIGETYGAGDGATTFNLPDLRGRVPVGSGQGAGGLSGHELGEIFGEETHQLSLAEMPQHRHKGRWVLTPRGTTSGSNVGTWGWSTAYSDNAGGASNILEDSGGDEAHNNLPPSLAMNFIIYAGT